MCASNILCDTGLFVLGQASVTDWQMHVTGSRRLSKYLARVPVTASGCYFDAEIAASGQVALPSSLGLDRLDAATTRLRLALEVAAREAALEEVAKAWRRLNRASNGAEAKPSVLVEGIMLSDPWGYEAAQGNTAQCDVLVGPFRIRVRVNHTGAVSGHRHLTTQATGDAIDAAVRGAVLEALQRCWGRSNSQAAEAETRRAAATARDRDDGIDWLTKRAAKAQTP